MSTPHIIIIGADSTGSATAHDLEIEPFLNPGALAVVQVPDAVFEPVRFCLAFLATAQRNGALVRRFTEVTDFICSGGSVTGVKSRITGQA